MIINLGCACQTIVITLKNDVFLNQPIYNGTIYQRAGKVNGKTNWISTSNNYALWYNAEGDGWMIGDVALLGSSTGGISSFGYQGRSSCPYNVSTNAWKYSGNYQNGGWIIADANDVIIECLTGNHRFYIYSFLGN